MLFRSDRKSTRLNSSHTIISYAVFCLKKKTATRVRAAAGPAHGGPAGRRPARRRSCLGRGCAVRCVWGGRCAVLTSFVFFFFNDPAPTEICPLSQHDALPI